MEDQSRLAWEREYSRKGRIYGRATQDLPGVPPGGRVLDVGCGDCRTLQAIGPALEGDPSCCLVGLDHARPALSLCRPLVSRVGNLHVLCGDARQMPFPDGSFDSVLLVHVLGHGLLQDRERMAREAARVARQGGTVFVRVFSRSDLRAANGTEVEEGTRLLETGICTHFFSTGEVSELFSPLDPVFLEARPWTMRVGGRHLKREEVQGLFRAGGGNWARSLPVRPENPSTPSPRAPPPDAYRWL